mgnify:CR=1 FL=1
MIQINIDNVNGLNESLQVGDAVYAIPTGNQSGAQDLELWIVVVVQYL